MNLVQFLDSSDTRRVGLVENGGVSVRVLRGWHSTYDLALAAARQGSTIAALVASTPPGEARFIPARTT